MRRRTVVAVAALIAAFALVGLPVPAGSKTLSTDRNLDQAAFTSLTIPANAAALSAPGVLDAAALTPGHVTAEDTFLEPGRAPDGPTARPKVAQPGSPSGSAWKAPKRKLTGYATFYDNGTTAMRLPRGTVVRICGKAAASSAPSTITARRSRAGSSTSTGRTSSRSAAAPSWSGTTTVTVSIY